MPSHIQISIPSNGFVRTETMKSVVKLVPNIMAQGGQVTLDTQQSSDLIHSRHYSTNRFLESQATHLLFIDSDMVFEPDLFFALYQYDKPVVSALCPKRSYDLDRIIAAARAHPRQHPFEVLRENIEYANDPRSELEAHEKPRIEFDLPFMKNAPTGAAFLLLKREALEAMIQADAVKDYPSNAHGTSFAHFYDFFSPVSAKGDEGARLLSEDLSFFERLYAAGIDNWIKLDAEIAHIGEESHGAGLKADYLARQIQAALEKDQKT